MLPTLSANTAKDLALTLDGDLVLDSTGDLAFVTGLAVLQQEMIFRLKTKQGDYLYQPQCGTALDSLIGKPASPETQDLAEETVRYALTHDGLLDDKALSITSYYSDASTLIMQILVDASFYGYADSEVVSLVFSVSLQEGLLL